MKTKKTGEKTKIVTIAEAIKKSQAAKILWEKK